MDFLAEYNRSGVIPYIRRHMQLVYPIDEGGYQL